MNYRGASGHRDPDVIRAFLAGLHELPPADVDKYIETAHRICGLDARKLLEELMPQTAWVVSTPFAKEHFGKGKAEDVVKILEARGIQIPDDTRARITSATDLDELDKWVVRAATASSATDLFD